MTRINADINPIFLTDQHLLAEYNELGLFYSSLRRSIKSKNGISNIPEKFTLNKGHVKFFYNKLTFVNNRYELLKRELNDRNFKLDSDRKITIDNEFPDNLYNNWQSNDADIKVIKERIRSKIILKPNWYRYNKSSLPQWLIKYYSL